MKILCEIPMKLFTKYKKINKGFSLKDNGGKYG